MESKVIPAVKQIALYLLVIMSGLFAGLHFAAIIAPVEQKMSVSMFTAYWQIVDGYMGKRMPVFGMTFLSLYVINLLFYIKQWRRLMFWIIAICFFILIVDIFFTGREQVPINKYIQSVNVPNLTPQQSYILADLKIKTQEHFVFRRMLMLFSFALLSITPFLLPKRDR